MDMPERIAIIAAMEREVRPMVKGWRRSDVSGIPGWQSGNVLVLCGGIGSAPASRAAELAVAVHQPGLLVSAGFAGSLDSHLRVPAVICPSLIRDSQSGQELRAAVGFLPDPNHTMVSVNAVANAMDKPDLALCHRAHAVDMEASAVAAVAHRNGIPFLAIKAISEDVDSHLPPLQPFIGASGEFRTVRFLAHAAPRPWLWRSVLQIAHNTSRAADSLCAELRKLQLAPSNLHAVHERRADLG
jgi:hypothetical protein